MREEGEKKRKKKINEGKEKETVPQALPTFPSGRERGRGKKKKKREGCKKGKKKEKKGIPYPSSSPSLPPLSEKKGKKGGRGRKKVSSPGGGKKREKLDEGACLTGPASSILLSPDVKGKGVEDSKREETRYVFTFKTAI